jgi:hypothetical protein
MPPSTAKSSFIHADDEDSSSSFRKELLKEIVWG